MRSTAARDLVSSPVSGVLPAGDLRKSGNRGGGRWMAGVRRVHCGGSAAVCLSSSCVAFGKAGKLAGTCAAACVRLPLSAQMARPTTTLSQNLPGTWIRAERWRPTLDQGGVMSAESARAAGPARKRPVDERLVTRKGIFPQRSLDARGCPRYRRRLFPEARHWNLR